MSKFLRLSGVVALALLAGAVFYGCDDDDAAPARDKAIDLTTDDAYANCFMVAQGGTYKFAARRVDGTPIAAASADWIWSTADGAAAGLVSEVSYKNGYVRFTAAAGKGNAVIAAFDAAGRIVWNWHVWFTPTPALQTYDNGSVFMDRDLGALSALAEDGALTFGLKYQWGRKDPFYGGESNEDAETLFARAREHTIVNPAYASDLAWKSVQGDGQTGTVAYATAHPMTFIYLTTVSSKDWLAGQDDTLWGNGGPKSNYDPCPAGYRVPQEHAWKGLRVDNVEDDPDRFGRYFDTQAGDRVWYPLCGVRWGDKSAGYLGYVGAYGVGGCWARSTTGANGGMFYYMGGSYIAAGYGMYRSYGHTVRCTKGEE